MLTYMLHRVGTSVGNGPSLRLSCSPCPPGSDLNARAMEVDLLAHLVAVININATCLLFGTMFIAISTLRSWQP